MPALPLSTASLSSSFEFRCDDFKCDSFRPTPGYLADSRVRGFIPWDQYPAHGDGTGALETGIRVGQDHHPGYPEDLANVFSKRQGSGVLET